MFKRPQRDRHNVTTSYRSKNKRSSVKITLTVGFDNKTTTSTNGAIGKVHRTNVDACTFKTTTTHKRGRAASEHSKFDHTPLKQKHTFVIRFPWSAAAARLDALPVPCPRLTAQQLSGAQSGRGGGRVVGLGGELQDD